MNIRTFSCIIVLLFLFPKPAHAYLDPGTGSYLFQILIAGLLGSLFFAKNIIKKIAEFVRKMFKNE